MLFKNTNEIKNILPIGVGNDFNRYKPHIDNAEKRFIVPIIGIDLYTDLVLFYDSEQPAEPTASEKLKIELIGKVQFAIIHLAFFIGFDFLNISVTDAGFQRIESERTKGLFKYQEDSLKSFFSEAGFNALDDILVFLETNVSSFENYMNSTNYTAFAKSFLPTVKVIQEIPFNIHNSRLILLALQPAIAFFEDTTIRTILGTTIYDTVKTEMAKETPDPKVELILPWIRKILIYLSTAMLMEETGATLEDKGLYFQKNEDQQRAKVVKGPTPADRIAILVSRNKNIANGYIEFLKSLLLANWENYNGQTGSIFRRDNNGKKTFWT